MTFLVFTGCVSFLWHEAVYRLHQFPVTWSCLQAASVFCELKLFTGCVSFLWHEAVYRLHQFPVTWTDEAVYRLCQFSVTWSCLQAVSVSCDMKLFTGCVSFLWYVVSLWLFPVTCDFSPAVVRVTGCWFVTGEFCHLNDDKINFLRMWLVPEF